MVYKKIKYIVLLLVLALTIPTFCYALDTDSIYVWSNNTSMLLTACGVGYVVMAVIYALFLICGIQHLSGWFIWILSGICLLSFSKGTLRKDLKALLFEGNNDVIVLLTIFLITLVLCFVLFRLPIRSVEITGYQDIPYDQMYWMKNSVAATKGFPLPELSVSGLNMYSVDVLKDKFYMKFPDNLMFNCTMLLSVAFYNLTMRFYPISWRETDQVSNVKMASQSIKTLRILFDYMDMPTRLRAEYRDIPREKYEYEEI